MVREAKEKVHEEFGRKMSAVLEENKKLFWKVQ